MSEVAPQRILIVRLSAIGDVVMASGMIRALRRRYPRARLVWLTGPGPDALLRANDELDEVIVWHRHVWRDHLRRGRWLQLAGECRQLIATLRRRQFDTAIDAQGLLKSGVWAWLSGASVRLGLGSKEGSQWLMSRVVERSTDEACFGSEYIDAVRALGASPMAFTPHIATAAADRDTATAKLKAHLGDRPYIALAPFTTRPQKHWFDRYWHTLIERLIVEDGWSVIVLGGPDDGEAGDIMVSAAASYGRATAVNLAGKTTLPETMAIIDQAYQVIGVDTGVTHMGTASGRPTLALFGSTRPYTAPSIASTRVLFQPMTCAPCHKHPTCGGRFTCMAELTPDIVLSAARWQLAEDTH
ncbi:glycosyltransferase family 9 protein [Salinisphaera sp. USBA-960]|uniref:glycosyltransferase family 9 protein n=1 Tax=Salinisphaera orenii TaxID=856731 RepID=UPI0013A62801|nr:glycosyltransferase family 9 protein [Salifodinibacter halophilus]NNC25449.1 glycosyltransferase family 9 protein [Salifodinibacter halophilus]